MPPDVPTDHLDVFDPVLAAMMPTWTLDLDAAPRRLDDDLAYGGMAFYRERNPDGEMPVIVEQAGQGRALRLTVRRDAYPNARVDGAENADRDRCELRDGRVPLGTEGWYGFSMRVPSDFPKVQARFVCAHMKAPYDVSGDGSPLFALRIEEGRLFATIEQLFEPGDTLTPYVEGSPTTGPGRAFDHHMFEKMRPGDPATVGKDTAFQVRVILATPRDGVPRALAAKYCHSTAKTIVETFAPLPALDDQWNDFVVGIKPSAALGEDGFVELRCDGALIARARGPFGYAGAPLVAAKPPEQYFKLGCYRDKDPRWGAGPATLEFRDVRRGTRADLLPDQPVA